jgi:hypothetical protein
MLWSELKSAVRGLIGAPGLSAAAVVALAPRHSPWPPDVRSVDRDPLPRTRHDFKRFLVLHVGDGHAKGEVDAAVRRHAVSDEAA